jgi:hypothetical protein
LATRGTLRRMRIVVTRDQLALDLRTYGEDALAERVLTACDVELEAIWSRAGRYALSPELAAPSGASMLIARAVALAAVDVLESEPKPLRWKRRKLKGIYPGH